MSSCFHFPPPHPYPADSCPAAAADTGEIPAAVHPIHSGCSASAGGNVQENRYQSAQSPHSLARPSPGSTDDPPGSTYLKKKKMHAVKDMRLG